MYTYIMYTMIVITMHLHIRAYPVAIFAQAIVWSTGEISRTASMMMLMHGSMVAHDKWCIMIDIFQHPIVQYTFHDTHTKSTEIEREGELCSALRPLKFLLQQHILYWMIRLVWCTAFARVDFIFQKAFNRFWNSNCCNCQRFARRSTTRWRWNTWLFG